MKTSVTELPFNRHLGLVAVEDASAQLELQEGPQYLYHLETIHAETLLCPAKAYEFLFSLGWLEKKAETK